MVYLLYFEYTIAPFPGMFCSLDQIICYVKSANVTPCPVKVITLMQFKKSAVGIVQSIENLEFYAQIICTYASTQRWFPLRIPRLLGTFRFVLRFLFSPLRLPKNVPGFSLFPFFQLSDTISSLAAPHLPLPFSDSETKKH